MIIPDSSSDSSEGVVPGSPQHPHNIEDRVEMLLQEFGRVPELFESKNVLDIGCADGRITCRIADQFFTNTIRGIDLDPDNIERAISNIVRPGARPIHFCREDYAPQTEAELNAEFEAEYDTILCLSVTRSMHLRGGDEGLKLCFRKMYKQLKFGGTLILEPNPYWTYDHERRRGISMFPLEFREYLQSIGFQLYSIQRAHYHPSIYLYRKRPRDNVPIQRKTIKTPTPKRRRKKTKTPSPRKTPIRLLRI
ncbi:hypothetical protein TKK_0004160 [Trichogramma kaykai]|uniref:RNA methyltransferase n=1 Tax=Trichogramma kaykai TaxID=54128 RepID=A0ABD2XLQ4_9HYME